jgi:hypothetical protein
MGPRGLEHALDDVKIERRVGSKHGVYRCCVRGIATIVHADSDSEGLNSLLRQGVNQAADMLSLISGRYADADSGVMQRWQ